MAKDFTPSSRNREAFEAMTDTVGNVPPQAVELEEAVLGALMLEKDCIITVQEFVSPEAFYTEEHRLIYKAINELSMELKPIDLYTVTERLKAKKELKKVGGASYLAQLTQKVGSAANVEFHAKIIAQKYVQRELIRSATEIQKRSYDESTDVTDLIGFAEQEIFKVAEGHVKRSVQSAADVLARTLAQIEENAKNKSAFNGVPSGFMALDRVTLGWQLSDLIIVAARAEENIYYEHQARHDQNRVGDVEHREVDKLELEHVHNVAEKNAVDAVAERAREKQHLAPHRKARVEHALDQQHGDHNDEHRRHREEYPARIVNIVKQAERRAGVVDINKLHHARDQLLRAGRERYINRDPIFQPLIRNEYHRGNDRKKHVPILSVLRMHNYII